MSHPVYNKQDWNYFWYFLSFGRVWDSPFGDGCSNTWEYLNYCLHIRVSLLRPFICSTWGQEPGAKLPTGKRVLRCLLPRRLFKYKIEIPPIIKLLIHCLRAAPTHWPIYEHHRFSNNKTNMSCWGARIWFMNREDLRSCGYSKKLYIIVTFVMIKVGPHGNIYFKKHRHQSWKNDVNNHEKWRQQLSISFMFLMTSSNFCSITSLYGQLSNYR